MNNPLRSIVKGRNLAAVALVAVAVPFAASTASAAPKRHWGHTQNTTSAAVTAAPESAAPAPSVTSVISIGGYVFYNLTYAEAVDAWVAAVAAAPPGYVPPTVYSVSVNTTVSGTVEDGNG